MSWTRPHAHVAVPYPFLPFPQWCHSTPTMIYMVALLADAQGWQASRRVAASRAGKREQLMPVCHAKWIKHVRLRTQHPSY